MLAGLVAEAQGNPALAAAWRDQVFEPLRARNTVLVRRAVDRGEIPPDTDADVVLDLLFGSAYHRLLQGHRPLSDQFARRVVDLIVAGVRAA
jgi:AcrR family transcriptional regulator